MVVKVLGSGCRNCVILTDNVKLALKGMGIEAEVQKVTDIQQIISYGVMSTPALVVDEKVVSFGKVLRPNEIIRILERVK
jgi:small redox-active disulfide protein 2